jgi:DeoR/GlpR family transcriptional regulator of sugar metabolism
MANMFASVRRNKILLLFKEDGCLKVQDLSRLFDISEVTIRHDLEQLEAEGYIKRDHGGAHLISRNNLDIFIQKISFLNHNKLEEKRSIARYAVSLINEGDVIIIDCGSTTAELAKLLGGFNELTVITNALNIALIAGSNPNITIILTGGEFKSSTLSLTGGASTAAFLDNLRADKAFITMNGISYDLKLSFASLNDVSIKQAMIKAGKEVILLVDSSKIGISSLVASCPLSDADYLITDSGITEEQKNLLQKVGINYKIV